MTAIKKDANKPTDASTIDCQIIPLITAKAQTKRPVQQTSNQKVATQITRAAMQVAADPDDIYEAWVTIVRPGGLVEQIDCEKMTT